MNAIAKTFNARVLTFRPALLDIKIAKWHMVVMFAAVLLTAFSLLYTKDLNRRMFINYQTMQQQNTSLHVDYSKLLLEESALSAQSRIQHLAQQKLDMKIPGTNDIKLVTL